MAFEDRSSPNAAASPNSAGNTCTLNSPNSPESTRTTQYTCTTIPANETRTATNASMNEKPSFFRIASFALSSSKHECQINALKAETSSPPSSPQADNTKSANQQKPRQRLPNDSFRECNGVIDEELSSNNSEELAIQNLKYSITNILHPDFGKAAVLKKNNTSTEKVAYKPYEDATTTLKSSPTIAPLGSLCQTVSQIGKTTDQSSKPKTSVLKSSLPRSEEAAKTEDGKLLTLWPAWVYCTRYSDRPSSGPRSRRVKKDKSTEEKRPRTAFSGAQLARLKHEFAENRYLTERRRQQLSQELGLNEAQIKIWFQNKRAKIKKASGQKNPLALQLMAQGLYNHSTVPCDDEEMASSS